MILGQENMSNRAKRGKRNRDHRIEEFVREHLAERPGYKKPGSQNPKKPKPPGVKK